MSDDDSKAIVSLLRMLVADVALLRAAVGGSRARALSSGDHGLFEKLLPEISAALGNSTWTVADLIEHGGLDAAFGVALRRILGEEPSRKRLGKLLARGAGSAIAGLEIERVARTRAGMIWRVSERI